MQRYGQIDLFAAQPLFALLRELPVCRQSVTDADAAAHKAAHTQALHQQSMAISHTSIDLIALAGVVHRGRSHDSARWTRLAFQRQSDPGDEARIVAPIGEVISGGEAVVGRLPFRGVL